MVEQFHFLQVVNSIEEISNFGHFEVIFLNVKIFFRGGGGGFGHFWPPRSNFKINFLNVKEKFL